MSAKIEYLEKYSVAPPPSRDYYGIKVLRDEVILFLWKISHGPHRAPTVRVTKFSDFYEDTTLQDEIRRIFGNYLLEHVKNITSSKEFTILTLPKKVIARITRYLRFKDIVNLSSLSHASKEVFDNDVVWETLYRKYKRSKISKEEKRYAMASSWKQLLKDKKLQESIRGQKPGVGVGKPTAFQSTVEGRPSRQFGKDSVTQKNPNLLPFFQKTTRDTKKLMGTVPTSRAKTATKLEGEKSKISLKSTTSMTKIPGDPRNKSSLLNEFKIDLEEEESISNRSQHKINKNSTHKMNFATKPKSNPSLKSTESQKPKKSSEVKSISNPVDSNRKQKLIPDRKIQSKEVEKPRKRSENKLISSSSDKTLIDDLHMDDVGFLIQESLKNFKSPRSIFDHDFSVLEDKKSAGDSINLFSRPGLKNFKDKPKVGGYPNSPGKNESHSDDDEELEIENFTQKYLTARAEFMKKMSEVNLTIPKAQDLSKSSSSGKIQKPIGTIPENLRKARASIFAAKSVETKNIIQERPEIRLTRGNRLKK